MRVRRAVKSRAVAGGSSLRPPPRARRSVMLLLGLAASAMKGETKYTVTAVTAAA